MALSPLSCTGRFFAAAGILAPQPHIFLRPASGFGLSGLASPLAGAVWLSGGQFMGMLPAASLLFAIIPSFTPFFIENRHRTLPPFLCFLSVASHSMARGIDSFTFCGPTHCPHSFFTVVFPTASGRSFLAGPVVLCPFRLLSWRSALRTSHMPGQLVICRPVYDSAFHDDRASVSLAAEKENRTPGCAGWGTNLALAYGFSFSGFFLHGISKPCGAYSSFQKLRVTVPLDRYPEFLFWARMFLNNAKKKSS